MHRIPTRQRTSIFQNGDNRLLMTEQKLNNLLKASECLTFLETPKKEAFSPLPLEANFRVHTKQTPTEAPIQEARSYSRFRKLPDLRPSASI
jgi:hypothetical protein